MRELYIMLDILKLKNKMVDIGLFYYIENGIVLEEQKRNFIIYNTKNGIESNRRICFNIKDACVDILKRIDNSLISNYLELCNAIKEDK